jgi:hypothetical protein
MRAAGATTAAALLVVPGVAHLLEFGVHTAAGTPRAGTAVLVSIAFSLITTRVNLFAMRHGIQIAGRGSATLAADLGQLLRVGGRLSPRSLEASDRVRAPA